MKRKLNDEAIPTPVGEKDDLHSRNLPSFEALHLDARILQALAIEGFSKPTAVQARTIPPIFEGRDVLGKTSSSHSWDILSDLVRAKTGSGKTLAYVLPILELIIRKKSVCCQPSQVEAFTNKLPRRKESCMARS